MDSIIEFGGRFMDDKKIKILLFVMILSLTGLLYFSYNFYNVEDQQNPVLVFLLDREIETGQSIIGHGEIVRSLIYSRAPVVKLVPIEVSAVGRGEGVSYLQALSDIVVFSDENPEYRIVVNISMSFPGNEEHELLIENLVQRNVAVVAAAGNNNSSQPIFPAGYPRVISVASADKQGKKEYSNYGEYVDLSAPGSFKYSSVINRFGGNAFHYLEYEGTSYSAPRVTGLLSNMLMVAPELDYRQALQIIKDTTTPIADSKFEEGALGAGMINEERALIAMDWQFRFILIFRYLSLALLLIISFLILKKRFGILSLIVFILLWIIIIPLLYILGNRFILILVSDVDFNYILLLVLSFLLLIKYSGWSAKVITGAYLLLLFFFVFIYDFNIKIMSILVPFLLLIIIELKGIYMARKTKKLRKILSYLESSSQKIRVEAQKRIASLSAGEIRVLFNCALNHPDYSSLFVEEVLPLVSKKVRPFLLDILKNGSPKEKYLAAECLQKYRSEELKSKLLTILKKEESNPRVILEILTAYNSFPQGTKDLIGSFLFSSSDMWVRYQALKTLAQLYKNESRRFLQIVEDLRDDEQQLVRLEAEYYYKLLTEEKIESRN